MDQSVLIEARISGRRVDFPSETEAGLAWAIEADIPITKEIRDGLNANSIYIPKTVSTIKLVDFNPQENLSKKLRNISTRRPFWMRTSLQRLVEPSEAAKQGLENFKLNQSSEIIKLFKVIIGGGIHERRKKREFSQRIEAQKGETIVIIEGHAGGDPWMIGEQGSHEDVIVKDETGQVIQRPGNSIPVEEIITKYDDPGKFAFILFVNCYIGKRKLTSFSSKVPMARINGISGSLVQMLGWHKTEMTTG